MATQLKDIIAKREELAKTNPNATNVDARKALTATPATPPIPATTNVMDQMAGKTVAERQAIRNGTPAPATPAPVTPPTVTGVDGQQFTQAPVDHTTGLSKPLETTPAPATPAPATTTPEQTPFQQAQAESEKIKAQNEAQMKLNTQQADIKTQERQQIAKETAQANIPTNQKDVLNALVSGVSVAPQNTQAYRNAQLQYKNYQKFATMTPTQLVDNMKMGEIDTETAGLLASNPNYIKAKQDYEKIQTTKSINNMIKATMWGMTGKTEEVDYYKNASDSIAKKLGINETNADAYARIVSKDPKTLELTNTVSSIAKQLNTLNTQRNEAYAELKKKYPDMSASALMTLMWSRTQDTTDQINALNSSLSLTQADLKMAMEMAQGEYEATQKDIAMQSQLAGEDRQMKNQLALSQAQFEQKVAQQTQQMSTPELAIPSVIEQYASQGIFAQKSAQQHIADAKALIAKGGTLGEYISQMQKDFQEKDAYKAKFTGNLNDTQKLLMQQEMENKRDARNFAQQKELAILNKDLWRQEFLWKIENDPEKKAKALELEQKLNANKSLFDVLGKNVGTYEGNRGYDFAGAIGDPLPAGGNWTVKSIDTAGEQVGSIFIGGKSKKPYGNTVVMQDENGNEIRYSHLQDIGVKQGDVLWFWDIVGTRGNTGNVKGANGEILTADQLAKGRGAHLDIEIKSNGKLLSNADQVKFLKGLKAGWTQPLDDLTSILKSGKLGEWTKTTLGTIMWVINATKDLEKSNPEWDLAGINPASGMSMDYFSSEKSIKNRAFLDAINLKVQQWASGASLTESQIQMVNKLVPKPTDTDYTAKAKANALIDFMNEQIKGTLQVNWIDYNPKPSSMWWEKSTLPTNTGDTNTGVWQSQTYQGYTIKWL